MRHEEQAMRQEDNGSYRGAIPDANYPIHLADYQQGIYTRHVNKAYQPNTTPYRL